MKHYGKIIQAVAALVVLSACTDYDMKDFQVDKPESVKEKEYLNQFDVLKNYVERDQNPYFRLGAGTGLNDYVKKGTMYRLLNDNFDEIVMGWEMKHGAIVQADGSLDLDNVIQLISTAREAGMYIYGHTLCWHANQNAEYLNGLIAPTYIEPEPSEPITIEYMSNGDFESGSKEPWYTWQDENKVAISNPGEGYEGQYALVLKNSDPGLDFWALSAMFNFSQNLEQGTAVTLKYWIKGTTEGIIRPALYDFNTWSGKDFPSSPITTQWQQVEVSTVVENANQALLFNFGDYIGQIFIDNISVTQEIIKEEPNYILEPSVIEASDFEDGDIGTWYAWGGANPTCVLSPEGEGFEGGYALKVTNSSEGKADWEGQFGYQAASNFVKGETYQLNMKIKGTKAATLSANIQLMEDPWPSDAFAQKVNVTTDWTDVEITVEATDSNRDHFLMSIGDYVGTLWIDNVTLCKVKYTNYIEKTDEEKYELIDNALETFIAGMMETCSDYIKAWDVVNEPMSDWPDPYEIKTGVGKTDMGEDEFYWQDYLGKEYAARAIQLARKYGGNDLTLFINDYGLEGAADQKKCLGLIEFVKFTENQGVKVDGIGTQMHVTCGETQLSNIELMFKNLAATGKLIKVSELDMGYYSAAQNRTLKTEELTREQELEMSQFYEDIVKAYFTHIPAAQRYGITQWCPLDSPAESSWRSGEPTGLWTLDHYRKYTYQGFVNGLAGKKVVSE